MIPLNFSSSSYNASSEKINFKNSESDMSEDIFYSQPKFITNVLNNLNALRMSGKFCDVEIVADNRKFKVHRAVLAASSPYFFAMFTGELCERNQERIELHGISSYNLDILLNFIYSGKANITQCNVQELFVTADMLGLVEVVKGCTEFLIKELQPHNAIGFYRFADDLNSADLKLVVEKYIHNNFPKVCNEDEIYHLEKDTLLQFISSEYLKIDSELQVFELVLRWINFDIVNRRQFVFEILRCIRLSLISFVLKKTITACNDCSLRVALKSIYSDLLDKKGCLVPLNVKPRTCAKKDIYVIGGSKREKKKIWDGGLAMNYVGIEKFDTFTREWNQVPNMTINRLVPGVAALNGHIYVVGGEIDSDILSSCERYDPQENQWSEIASMLVSRCEFGLCAVDGYLYAMGGWIDDEETDMCDSIERYDPKVNSWSRVGSLPEPRFSMGLVSYEGLIYMVGGCSSSKRNLKDLMSYNPATGEWKTLPSMSTPRFQMGVAVLDDDLYVVGGTNKQEVLDSVERYNFKMNKWSQVPSMKVERSGPAVAAVNSLLYVIGGAQTHKTPFYRAQCTISSVECFDPMSNCWSECPPLSETRAEAGAVVV
ncbi:hypothetical protein WA026_014806 [Henosepilachna vigintioctopunctata]|uniref:Kelch-like protein diablo n=1 Tax=Henosepilachna vigintioctopunctata TaxID=420089 RepID=A0AAW1UY00_9CUCU